MMKKIILFVLGCISSLPLLAKQEVIDFNINVLNAEDRENLNLDVFSKSSYIVPGTYLFKININESHLPEERIDIISVGEDSEACLTTDLVEKFNLNSDTKSELKWLDIAGNQCVDLTSLPGVAAIPNLSDNSLSINIPKAYQEYTDYDWEPPSRWEDGINGFIADYNITTQLNHNLGDNKGNDAFYIGSMGAFGFNFSDWRLRANWQGSYNHTQNNHVPDNNDFIWSSIYAYKAVRSLKAKLLVGEDYLSSDLFDNFRFTGFSLRSDDNMLPPNLRSYAPEVTGYAETDSVVKISQDGRVIYESLVPAGPFRIQNLSSGLSGTLTVKIEGNDGKITEYNMEATSIPYLSRPGSIRYKFTAGRPTDIDHRAEGDLFAQGEISWGVTNGWSLYAGSLNSEKYNAFSLGVGRDLYSFGASSFAITQSIASLPNNKELRGKSYKISYYKSLQDYNSQFQFAGYRFADKSFMTMSDFINYSSSDKYVDYAGYNKDLYTISFSKNFPEWKSSLSLNSNYQTYWDRPSSNRYNVTYSKYFETDSFKGMSLSINAYQNKSQNYDDNGIYIGLSIPLSNGSSINYSTSHSSSDTTNKITLRDKIDDKNSYSLGIGNNKSSGLLNGYYTHKGNYADFNASFNYISNNAFNLSSNTQGGFTMTAMGGDMHPITTLGGIRMLIDTNGVSGIPIKSNGAIINSNLFGKVIVSDLNSYYKNSVKIDINKLPNNAEVRESIVQSTLTEGAIGYRKFEIIHGMKKMVVIRLEDGSFPPFAAEVINDNGQVTGIVADLGEAYIGGIKPNQNMKVLWQDQECTIRFPDDIDQIDIYAKLLLSCTN